jgi:hypothetical protein
MTCESKESCSYEDAFPFKKSQDENGDIAVLCYKLFQKIPPKTKKGMPVSRIPFNIEILTSS